MVLAFTEEQKKRVEARGMTVIEFKRRLRNMEKPLMMLGKFLMKWLIK
jgi:hypothetical protein